MPAPSQGADGGAGHSANPVRWARAQELFHAAADLPVARQMAYLDSQCGGDTALRNEVASLLASDALAGAFIDQPAAAMLAPDTPAFRPRFAPGAVIGRYEILAFLGVGGVSEVYRARDSRLGRQVAVKFITDPDDREAGRRLLQEAQHASVLNHPHICAVFEADDREALPFIVLELVEGPTLHDMLQQRRATPGEALKWATDIAAALEHAHSRGIIHRDLKSANIALSPDGGVKVLDFGLSRRSDAGNGLTTPAAIITDASVAGTLTHIAPEVLRGQPLDQRIDVWALGVVLYEMVSGVLPFKGHTPAQTATAILEAPPPPLPPHVPPRLQHVIGRCLEKDPARRFSTAAEVRAALLAVSVEEAAARPRRRTLAAAAVLLGAVIAWWAGAWPARSSETSRRIVAVMPFADGGDSDAYYANGIAEGIIGELGRVDGIRVLAAGTTLRAKDPTAMRDAAREVGATHFLEGRVERTGADIRLTVHLIDASTDRPVWTETYQRSAREAQPLHAAVAAGIARQAEVTLEAADARYFGAVRAVNPDVYEEYLKGRYHWNQRTTASIRTAISHFERALALDPTYAPAYAALADGYNQLATVLVSGGRPAEWRPKAADAAIKALQIDGNLAEAHATLGYVRHYDWQWQDAEAALGRAIALNPSYSMARIWYANLLCSQRRFDEAIREVLVARDLDPLSLIVRTNVGWVFFRARRNDEAIAEYQHALTLDSTYLQAHIRLADAYLRAGRFDEAIEHHQIAVRLSNGSLANLVWLEQTKKLAGRDNAFDARLAELVARASDSYVSPGTIANAYFTDGQHAEGFRWLAQAYRERTNNMVYLAVEPVYDQVRHDPRFQELSRAIGLP